MWILLSSTQISLVLSLLISAGAGRESAGAGRGSARRGSPSSAPALVRPVHALPARPRSMCAARESVGAGALAGRGVRGTGRANKPS